ncbi:unnamed protein product [Ostreobium quekettii]|uniref:Uncharacterized protein n=1 Tax=Ostreobium quekettii TaxID=121088 RepID=A0A8S1J2Q4_9CHLO|nr:unnamed protein product [Ostreobium quekettii]
MAIACLEMQEEHLEMQRHEVEQYKEAKAYIEKKNREEAKRMRQAHADAVREARRAHDEACEAARLAHTAEVEKAKLHNASVWHEVQVAKAAKEELARVSAFMDHISMCGRKLQLGINYHPGVPNLHRVVEMQALTEALRKAFPELKPHEYPWPGNAELPCTGQEQGPCADKASGLDRDPARHPNDTAGEGVDSDTQQKGKPLGRRQRPKSAHARLLGNGEWRHPG